MLRTLALSASVAVLALAAAQPAKAQELDGKKLFLTKTCVACHGRDGKKPIQTYPELAGQQVDYLLRQMDEIASGARLSGLDARGYPRTQGMKDIMHLVSAEERAVLADWLSKQPPPKVRALDPAPTPEQLAEGKKAYTQAGCQTCHGVDGLKPLATYPSLGGMKRDYVILQVKEMRDGIRVNGKSKAMLPFAKKVDDAKIELIATYLSQIERPAK